VVRVIAVFAAVVLVTLPFGFYRAYTRRLSLRWFLAIHVPVVVAFLLRTEARLSYAFIPLTAVAFAAAQFGGARLGRWWIKQHPVEQRQADATSGEPETAAVVLPRAGDP